MGVIVKQRDAEQYVKLGLLVLVLLNPKSV